MWILLIVALAVSPIVLSWARFGLVIYIDTHFGGIFKIDRANGNKQQLNYNQSTATQLISMAPKNKRKYSSSVAAAARDALYSSSSDSSEEDEFDSDDESEQSSSSSEEDEPIRKKKKVSASSKSNTTSKKSTTNHTTNTKAKYSRRHLKPLFEKGDKVFSAWWKDKKRSGETQWYPGSIKSYTEEETNSPYGPTRYYDIDFDDGDELYNVEDYYVFPEVDYILQQKNDFKPNWIGVKNVTDKSMKGDRWPGDVGWYVAVNP